MVPCWLPLRFVCLLFCSLLGWCFYLWVASLRRFCVRCIKASAFFISFYPYDFCTLFAGRLTRAGSEGFAEAISRWTVVGVLLSLALGAQETCTYPLALPVSAINLVTRRRKETKEKRKNRQGVGQEPSLLRLWRLKSQD